jgi:hypothetical protein
MAPKTIEEAGLLMPVLVDEIDNPLWCSYGRMPNNAYLIGMDGRAVCASSGKIPPRWRLLSNVIWRKGRLGQAHRRRRGCCPGCGIQSGCCTEKLVLLDRPFGSRIVSV